MRENALAGRNMKKLLIIALSLLFAACGGGGGTGGGSAKMDIKAGGRDTGLAIKSSGTDKSVKTFTDKEGKVTTATSFYAIMANYDMDTANFASMKKTLTAPDQARVMLQLIGEEGTDQKSEFKPGTYKADPAGKFMKLDSLVVTTFADGKEVATSFDTNFSASKITGQVVVKSVTADAISGDIDVSEGDKSVKGAFTAKIAAPKK
jgi:flagellar basal body rod protein FlgC